MRNQYYIGGKLFNVNESYEGKSIEQQLAALMQGETMETKGKAMVYTERKEGVLPETDIRSDKWELAQDAHEYVTRSNIAKRDETPKEVKSTSETTEGTTEK